jgi:hypothetical protein
MWWHAETKALARETAKALEQHLKECKEMHTETRRLLSKIILWVITSLLTVVAILVLKILQMRGIVN